MNGSVQEADREMDEQVQVEESSAWGKRLREIREANNISLEEVVAALRLEPKLIQQIEDEDLEQLPNAPFVKGYLRGYCRMLNIDSAPILEAYGKVCGEDAPGLTKVTHVRELTSKDAAPRSATWIVVGVLIVSVLVWWWSQLISIKKSGDEAATAEQQQAAPAVTAEGAADSGVIELALPEQPQQQALPQAQPQSQTQSSGATASAPAAAPAVEETKQAETKQATITMKFNQESWVDITDATGARLFMDLAKAGTSRTVTGVPPFNVLLGNAPAVLIEYNGAPYNHYAHATQGIARFTLGAAQ